MFGKCCRAPCALFPNGFSLVRPATPIAIARSRNNNRIKLVEFIYLAYPSRLAIAIERIITYMLLVRCMNCERGDDFSTGEKAAEENLGVVVVVISFER